MATLAQMTAWRDRLQEARYMGLRRVRDQNGEEVEYKTDAEMARALAALESEIMAAGKPAASTIVFKTSKGV